jgi:hypothetical protein
MVVLFPSIQNASTATDLDPRWCRAMMEWTQIIQALRHHLDAASIERQRVAATIYG